jgi:methylmalonyl-CoA/ethylmalonyl-CoA epimerase
MMAIPPTPGSDTHSQCEGWVFHHLGLACREFKREMQALGVLGYTLESGPFSDPGLGVEVAFLTGSGPRIELVAALPGAGAGSEVLAGWLNRGTKLYHTAYEVPNLHELLETRLSGQAKLVLGPQPAVAFQGREVAFLMMRNGLLVELIAA